MVIRHGIARISGHFCPFYIWMGKRVPSFHKSFWFTCLPTYNRGSFALFSLFPFNNDNNGQWLARMSSFLERQRNTQASSTELKGDAAGEIILTSSYEPYSVVGFDVTEATRLGLKRGRFVKIAPDDTGKLPLVHGPRLNWCWFQVVTTPPPASLSR